MKIKQLTTVNQKVLNKINSLLPELFENASVLSLQQLEEMINDDNTTIFIAEENEEIIGMLTFVIYRIPSGLKAWIEDVVVDKEYQGKGIGKILVQRAIDYAKELGINKIDLTSSLFRVAANILYPKLGFKKRETNVYRLEI
ncbi:MAG: GNAT family N-acetyltransferase [Bacteroidales bacterium]|nr:GNAT family N-acetyltransferase [Bacteroidales bacterium]